MFDLLNSMLGELFRFIDAVDRLLAALLEAFEAYAGQFTFAERGVG